MIVDANRLLGPVPDEAVVSATVPGLLSEMDRLGIDAAWVTHTRSLYSDPAEGNAELLACVAGRPRLRPLPVALPGDPLGGNVRLCPVRHGFDLGDPSVHDWLSGAVAIAVALPETTIGAVRSLAQALPSLRILLLSPGYRRLRELSALMGANHNIYIETGTLNTQRGVEWLAARHGAQRLVFGTGAPLFDDGGPRFQLDHLDLSPDDRDRIASGWWQE